MTTIDTMRERLQTYSRCSWKSTTTRRSTPRHEGAEGRQRPLLLMTIVAALFAGKSRAACSATGWSMMRWVN